MNKVAEELVAEGIVAHVLHQAPAISERMRMLQIVGRALWKPLLQYGLYAILPCEINNLFVSEYRIGMKGPTTEAKRRYRRYRAQLSHSHRRYWMQRWTEPLLLAYH